MKLINKLLGLGLLVLFASACAKDNFPEPNRQIKVTIVSKPDLALGNTVVIPTRNSKTSNFNFNVVQTDEKWTNSGTDYAFTNEVGEVNMNWFDGTYLFFAPPGRGPWRPAQYANPVSTLRQGQDTIVMEIKGKKTYEYTYPVDPYYLFQDVKYTLTGNVLTATGTIKEYNAIAITDMYLVIKNSALVCNLNYEQRQAITRPAAGSFPATFSVSMTISEANLEKVTTYARVVMKFTGKEDWQMGPIQKMR